MQGDTRADRIDADTVAGRLDRRATGQGHDPGLGRGVVRLLLLRAPAEHRGVVDDDPGAALHHLRQHRAGHAHGAGEGDVEHPLPLLVGHVDQRP
ncbi:hypothetical protein D3C85_1461250 [compost metagenome]